MVSLLASYPGFDSWSQDFSTCRLDVNQIHLAEDVDLLRVAKREKTNTKRGSYFCVPGSNQGNVCEIAECVAPSPEDVGIYHLPAMGWQRSIT